VILAKSNFDKLVALVLTTELLTNGVKYFYTKY